VKTKINASNASDRGKTIGEKVAIATKGNGTVRRHLLRDPNPLVAVAAITSPATQESDVVSAVQSRMVHGDVINLVARDKSYVKLYAVKLALVQNPKTLLPTAMKLVGLLHKRDIKILSKSKNIPMGVRNLAMKLSKEGDS
jgi:hypothetical protein